MTVNNSNARQAAERGLVKKLIHTASCFLYGATDDVYFFVRGFFALLGVNGYPSRTCSGGELHLRGFFVNSDTNHVRKRNAHPENSRLHFRLAAIQPAEDQRLFESFHNYAQSGG